LVNKKQWSAGTAKASGIIGNGKAETLDLDDHQLIPRYGNSSGIGKINAHRGHNNNAFPGRNGPRRHDVTFGLEQEENSRWFRRQATPSPYRTSGGKALEYKGE